MHVVFEMMGIYTRGWGGGLGRGSLDYLNEGRGFSIGYVISRY